jgi:hypothetical protein
MRSFSAEGRHVEDVADKQVGRGSGPWSARGSQVGSPERHPSAQWVVGELDLKGAEVDERSLVGWICRVITMRKPLIRHCWQVPLILVWWDPGRGRSLCSSIGQLRSVQQGLGWGEGTGGC